MEQVNVIDINHWNLVNISLNSNLPVAYFMKLFVLLVSEKNPFLIDYNLFKLFLKGF